VPKKQVAIHLLVPILLLFALACSVDREQPAASNRTFEVPENGRLTIDAADLEDVDRVILILQIPDDGPTDASRPARIAHLTAGRVERSAEPIPGSPGRFSVTLPREQLALGLSMIEVDTIEEHPLNLRRFIVNVENAPNQGAER